MHDVRKELLMKMMLMMSGHAATDPRTQCPSAAATSTLKCDYSTMIPQAYAVDQTMSITLARCAVTEWVGWSAEGPENTVPADVLMG